MPDARLERTRRSYESRVTITPVIGDATIGPDETRDPCCVDLDEVRVCEPMLSGPQEWPKFKIVQTDGIRRLQVWDGVATSVTCGCHTGAWCDAHRPAIYKHTGDKH